MKAASRRSLISLRLDTDAPEHGLAAVPGEGEPVAKGFETDWIVKPISVSPTEKTRRRSSRSRWRDGTVGLGLLRNIGRDLARIDRQKLLAELGETLGDGIEVLAPRSPKPFSFTPTTSRGSRPRDLARLAETP
jgi:predicted component of type VI protein secretion system